MQNYIGVLGSVLFLSFSVLFLIFGQEHWSILALAVVWRSPQIF